MVERPKGLKTSGRPTLGVPFGPSRAENRFVEDQHAWDSDRSLAWSMGSASIVLMATTLVFMYVDRSVALPQVSDGWSFTNVFDILVNVGVPVIGIVIASRRPQSPIGWVLLAAGLALGLTGVSRAYALHALVADPGSLPGGRFAGWIANAIWPIPVALLPFLFLLFPDGHLPSPRWRPVAWFSGAALALILFTTGIFATSIWARPFTLADRARGGWLTSIALTLFLIVLFAIPVATFLSFASLAVRFAGSVGDERVQLKWFVTAALLVAVTFTSTLLTNVPLASVLFDIALLLLYVAIGIAILKHRLYDIDVIINKALVYGLLAAFISVVYVAIVVVVGTFVGATQFLSLIATAIVAVAFQPARDRAKRAANRVIYGKRATPYEVLSGFSEHVSETYAGEDILPRMARLMAEGTGATDATVWLRVGSEMIPAASWPTPAEPRASVASEGDVLPTFSKADVAVPVRHGNEILGALSVAKPPNDPILPEEERLLADLAAQAGLLLENFRLIEDLRSSRQRLVAAQDEERRRLERNLHDGAQQQLVALAVKVRMAEGLVGQDAQRQREALHGILDDAQDALANLRDLAHGIYPPLLADRGLSDALEAQARKAPVPVVVDHDGVGRYPPEVEAAVYFSVLEALQNVAKYAQASNVIVRVHPEPDGITFSVSDDGRGFQKETTSYGMGLQNIADRLAALDGELDVRTSPGEGTIVSGRIPIA
jgi:signal transduction histidine kinase